MSSAITDGAKFNSSSSYYLAKDPAGGGSPPQTIDGSLVVSGSITAGGTTTSTGLITGNGGLTITGASTLQTVTATSLTVPPQPLMGTASAPIVFNLSTGTPSATLTMVGNKAYITVNNANAGVTSVSLSITNPDIIANNLVPFVYTLSNSNQTYSILTSGILVRTGQPLLFNFTTATSTFCLVLV